MIKARHRAARRFGAACVVVLLAANLCGKAVDAQTPVDRFLASLDDDASLPAEAARLIQEAWSKCQDCDADELLTQGLAVLSRPFRLGLDAYDGERYDECAGIMAALRSDPNPFVAVNAAAYEIKALVASERLLEAGQRIEQLLSRQADAVTAYSYFAPEIALLRGYCLLADLQYEQAAEVLRRFLPAYPDASQPLVLAAQQILAELETRQPGRIGEVVDLMGYAGRRLTRHDSGERVRTRQKRVIEILDRLIKEAEEQERSNSSSGSGGRNAQGSESQAPSSPMEESILPGGSAQKGRLQARRRANPGETWGAMPPAQRERILQALRDSFPSRYRQLVEQYYEELGKKP